jgi:hypothetical protein
LYLQQIEICKYCLGEKYVPGYWMLKHMIH